MTVRITIKDNFVSDVTREQLQACCLGILLEFDRIAKENNISYFLVGGTLLGAKRHQGFIPWDDDIDIGIPRIDYDRLLTEQVSCKYPYLLEKFDPNSDYIYPYAKLYDGSTIFVEKLRIDFRRGVWIDVFPIDGTFKNPFFRKLHHLIVQALRRLFAFKITTIKDGNFYNEKNIFLKKIVHKILSFFSARIIFKSLDYILKIIDVRKAKYVGNMLGAWGEKELMPRNIFFGKLTTIKFCDSYFPAPADPHRYLSALYGDYMKLPPLHKRVGHMAAFVDLKHGYAFNADDKNS